MYQALNKDMIELEIVPYLLVTKRGFKPKAPLDEIINAIFHKLKTCIQWVFLPVGSLFSNEILRYKTIFGHHRKWCELDVWKSCRIELLKVKMTSL